MIYRYQAVVVDNKGMSIKIKTPELGGSDDDDYIPPLNCNDDFRFPVPKPDSLVEIFVSDDNQVRYYLPVFDDASTVTQDTDHYVIGDASKAEKAAKGETLVKQLGSICDQIKAGLDQCALLTVTCAAPGSPSSPPVNLAAFQAASLQMDSIKQGLQDILSEILKTT